MGVQLSRDIAQLMPYVPLCDITPTQRLALGAAAEQYETVADLPDDLRLLVVQAQDKKLPSYVPQPKQ